MVAFDKMLEGKGKTFYVVNKTPQDIGCALISPNSGLAVLQASTLEQLNINASQVCNLYNNGAPKFKLVKKLNESWLQYLCEHLGDYVVLDGSTMNYYCSLECFEECREEIHGVLNVLNSQGWQRKELADLKA